MEEIPRFNAQVIPVSVPKMRDYEYEQNRSIYQTLKKAGERINNTFFEMVAQGKIGEPSGTEQNKTYWDRYQLATGLKQPNNNFINTTNQPIDESGC